jgi:hypothetical protein
MKRLQDASSVLLLLVLASGAAAAETANVMWRFDGNGRFPNIRPPTAWRADSNVLWKTTVGVGGYSSPIVVQGKVFVTAEMGSLVCLNVADGTSLWTKDLFSKDIPADLSRKLMRGGGGESKQSTPTSNGSLVFYGALHHLAWSYNTQRGGFLADPQRRQGRTLVTSTAGIKMRHHRSTRTSSEVSPTADLS